MKIKSNQSFFFIKDVLVIVKSFIHMISNSLASIKCTEFNQYYQPITKDFQYVYKLVVCIHNHLIKNQINSMDTPKQLWYQYPSSSIVFIWLTETWSCCFILYLMLDENQQLSLCSVHSVSWYCLKIYPQTLQWVKDTIVINLKTNHLEMDSSITNLLNESCLTQHGHIQGDELDCPFLLFI